MTSTSRSGAVQPTSNCLRQLLGALSCLAGCLVLFELLPLDMRVQEALFDRPNQQWIWNAAEPVTRLLFYDGPKRLFILFVLCLALSLLLAKRSAFLNRRRGGIRIALLSLLLVPALVGALKSTTNVACPRNLVVFGGDVAYVGVTGSYTAAQRPSSKQRCYPAGHASGGFALLSLLFLAGTARGRRIAIYLGLTVGWVTGVYKMLIGDHFLSHTIASMLLAWSVINALALVEGRICNARRGDL